MRRIAYLKDRDNFGNEIVVFDNETNYLVVEIDREIVSYFFVDLALTRLYPMNTYMKKSGIAYDAMDPNWAPKKIDIDLHKYGFSSCPEWLKTLLRCSKR